MRCTPYGGGPYEDRTEADGLLLTPITLVLPTPTAAVRQG
jgi:hypothetical protein